jgi:tRNA dimethylallyltransferase
VGKSAIILLAGPTASGKSALALALALAEKFGGTVINADSMQVYRDLRIITARPSVEEERRVPHRLYGHVDAAENYSVGAWRNEVAGELAAAERESRAAIVAGGTGLYFNALTRGLAAMPAIPTHIRDEVRRRLDAEGATALYGELQRLDAAAASRLNQGDSSRVSRALEVRLATGRSILDWHKDDQPRGADHLPAVRIFLRPERDELARRIDARFDAMIEAGAIDEVRALMSRNLDANLPAMKAHGVPWLVRALRGEITLAEAVEGAKRDTRQYTKRQATWFRNQLPEFAWVEPAKAFAAAQSQLHDLTKGRSA